MLKSKLEKKFSSFLENFHKETKYYLAVSGGVDSMALLGLFLGEETILKEQITILHFNHKIRQESDQDEQFLEDFAEEHGVFFRSKSLNIIDLAKKEKNSIENQGRLCRYCFFQEAMQGEKEAVLVTGHHLEDQTESIFLHLIRGAGMEGLIGMRTFDYFPDRNMCIFRPLLEFSKDKLISFCKRKKISWHEDWTNQSREYVRNFFRLDILPAIRKEVNPNLDEALYRLSEILYEENAYLDHKAKKLFQEISYQSSSNYQEKFGFSSFRNNLAFQGMGIEKTLFLKAPIALQRRMIRLLYPFSFEEVERILEVFSKGPGKRLILYDMIFLSDYDAVIVFSKDRLKEIEKGDFLHFQKEMIDDGDCFVTDQSVCFVNMEGLDEEMFSFRTYQSDDYFHHMGGGKKELRKLFNSWKLSSLLRKNWPIFCYQNEILWVPFCGRSGLYLAKKNKRLLRIEGRI